MKLRRIIVGLVAVVVGGGIGAYLGLRNLDLDHYKDEIAAEVKDITGRDLEIKGHITFTLSLRPTVTLRDLALANAPWAGEKPFLEVGEAVITFDVLRLLFGVFDTTEVFFGDGTLRMVSNADGVGNWELSIDSEGVEKTEDYLKGPFPYVHGIQLRNFDYSYGGAGAALTLKGRMDEFLALYDTKDHDLQVGLKGSVKKQEITAKGTASEITRIYAGGASQINFDIGLGQTKLSLQGVADSTGTQPAFQGDYTASGPGLLDLAQLAAIDLPDLGALVASGKLTVTDDEIALTELDARLGLSDLAGKASLGLGPDRPVAANLTSSRLDLSPWLADLEEEVPASVEASVEDEGKEGLVFSDAPLGLAKLPPLDLDVKLQTDSFTAGGLTLTGLQLHVKQTGPDLQIDPVRVGYKSAIFGGSVSLKVQETPQVTLKVLTQNFDLGSFLEDNDVTDLVTGDIDVALDVAGQGDSLHALVAGADGKAGLVMFKGEIASRYVDLIAVDLLQQMMPWKKSIKEAQVKCALGQFKIESGKADIKSLLFDTKNMNMTGTGYIDLSDEKINLRLYPRPKDPSLFSLATGLEVKGTLTDASVSVNPLSLAKDIAEGAIGVALLGPAGILIPFASLGAGHHHPCVNDLIKIFGPEVAKDLKDGNTDKALADEGSPDSPVDTSDPAKADNKDDKNPIPTEVLISLSASQITDSVMRQHLEDLGFTNIASIEKSGTVFHVKADWQDQPVTLRIDGRLGTIAPISP